MAGRTKSIKVSRTSVLSQSCSTPAEYRDRLQKTKSSRRTRKGGPVDVDDYYVPESPTRITNTPRPHRTAMHQQHVRSQSAPPRRKGQPPPLAAERLLQQEFEAKIKSNQSNKKTNKLNEAALARQRRRLDELAAKEQLLLNPLQSQRCQSTGRIRNSRSSTQGRAVSILKEPSFLNKRDRDSGAKNLHYDPYAPPPRPISPTDFHERSGTAFLTSIQCSKTKSTKLQAESDATKVQAETDYSAIDYHEASGTGFRTAKTQSTLFLNKKKNSTSDDQIHARSNRHTKEVEHKPAIQFRAASVATSVRSSPARSMNTSSSSNEGGIDAVSNPCNSRNIRSSVRTGFSLAERVSSCIVLSVDATADQVSQMLSEKKQRHKPKKRRNCHDNSAFLQQHEKRATYTQPHRYPNDATNGEIDDDDDDDDDKDGIVELPSFFRNDLAFRNDRTNRYALDPESSIVENATCVSPLDSDTSSNSTWGPTPSPQRELNQQEADNLVSPPDIHKLTRHDQVSPTSVFDHASLEVPTCEDNRIPSLGDKITPPRDTPPRRPQGMYDHREQQIQKQPRPQQCCSVSPNCSTLQDQTNSSPPAIINQQYNDPPTIQSTPDSRLREVRLGMHRQEFDTVSTDGKVNGLSTKYVHALRNLEFHDNVIVTLQKKVSDSNQALEQTKQELEKSRADMSKRSQAFEEASANIFRERIEVEKKLRKEIESNDFFKKQLTDLKGEVSRLRDAFDQNKNSATYEDNKATNDAVERLSADLLLLRSEVVELRSQLSEAHASNLAKDTEIFKLRGERDDAHGEVDQLNERCQKLQQDATTLSAKSLCSDHHNEIILKQVNDQLHSLQSDLEESKRKVNDQTEKNKALEEKLSETQNLSKKYEVEVLDLRSELTQIQAQVHNEIKYGDAETQKLLIELADIKDNLSRSNSEIINQAAAHRRERERLQTELAESKEVQEILQSKVATLDEELAHSEVQNHVLDSQQMIDNENNKQFPVAIAMMEFFARRQS